MMPPTTEERAYCERLEREASQLSGLKALEDWYLQHRREVWEPFNREIQRLQQDPNVNTADPEVRDRVARELGVEGRSRALDELYRRAVAEYIGRSAEELSRPDSDAHREVIDRFDAAWRELATR
jgi:hypothetical protein